MNFYKIVIPFILMSMTLFAQTYIDEPYLQDYADKFAFEEIQKSELLQVRSDRNGVVNILSTDGLLQPFENKAIISL